MTPPSDQFHTPPKIWWSNAVFFVSVHIAALAGTYHMPPTHVPRLTLLMSLVLWQLADFGVTIGYHRLYSHRAFRASLPVRIVLVALGSIAFQGSVKTRLTSIHRYAATRGLLYSHMGWIFFKPKYERIEWVDREDLDNDPVVRFQHMYYVQIAFILGYVVPILLGYSWGDPVGAFIYGGLVTRLAVWHCTFLVNSLAHWEGAQPYSDENTSRGNLILALLTGGEGNHNFHAFPHDYRSGPSRFDWDPSKWIIASLYHFGLVSSVRRARPQDIKEAKRFMNQRTHDQNTTTTETDKAWNGPEWRIEEIEEYAASKPEKCIIVIDGFVVDVTAYLKEHPGGAKILRNYSIRRHVDGESWRDASWAFDGGLNNHSRAARRRMCELRVAKLMS
ncbi:hypothetical protein PAXINDRAFT_176886 [Paxillus involutus ATCC 200175]|uniref:Cytochrome b5 heme-binding domain-containing protein n=1 Tax=Paxillus involutus ATCC 200175 TaxID=664439 RepID=A0A0C9SW87_PAXIN|nr:hypothetical protein PAXINDRAFT_176886 [Paxillus involutus ATCC 200175]